MSDEEIYAGLAEVARAHLDYEGPITPELRLVEAMELDSIRMLTLVVEVENHFELDLEEGDEEGIETAGELVALLRRRLG